jgi:hypothetical protein
LKEKKLGKMGFVFDKQAYTHGFEEIYSLEKVDLRSIRKIEKKSSSLEDKETGKRPEKKEEEERELFEKKQEKIANLRLEEPISLLSLSLQTEKRLREAGYKEVKELLNLQKEGYLALKSLGFGHIDELNHKLAPYLHEEPQSAYIHYESIILSLFSELENRYKYLLLDKYRLYDLLQMTPQQKMSARAAKEMPHLMAMAKGAARTPEALSKVSLFYQKIGEAFLFPWLEKKQKVIHERELEERLIRKGATVKTSAPLYFLIKELYFEGVFPFKEHLYEVEPSLFTCSLEIKERFCAIKEAALAYFYAKEMAYPLVDLVRFLQEEAAKRWLLWAEEKIHEVFEQSALFLLYKDPEGRERVTIRPSKSPLAIFASDPS